MNNGLSELDEKFVLLNLFSFISTIIESYVYNY